MTRFSKLVSVLLSGAAFFVACTGGDAPSEFLEFAWRSDAPDVRIERLCPTDEMQRQRENRARPPA